MILSLGEISILYQEGRFDDNIRCPAGPVLSRRLPAVCAEYRRSAKSDMKKEESS
jgi:hypothetical protein